MEAIKLRTEYMNDPIGIDVKRPMLSWNVMGGIRQSAFRIRAFRNDGEEIWDSGKVSSDSMTGIHYGGIQLSSRDRVTWQVMVWDENDNESEWSKEARFEIALFEDTLQDKDQWKAKWITGDYCPNKKERYPVDCFRKLFIANRDIKKARVYITACGLYRLFINGTDCNNFELAPGITDYKKRIQYQTIDITDKVMIGQNVLLIQLADGWYRGGVGANSLRCQYGVETKAIYQIEIEYSNDNIEKIYSDGTEEWSNDGSIVFADNKEGQNVDARSIPSFSGKAKISKDKTVGKLVCSNNLPIVKREEFVPNVIKTKKGATVFDFGQNIAGQAEIRVDAKAGQKIRLRFGEMLDGDGEFTQDNIQIKRKNKPASPAQKINYICKDGLNIFRNYFSIFGFQYVLLEGDVELKPENIKAIAVYTDLEQIGYFHCSNDLINKFVESTIWSAKGNNADIPTDCPTRERHGWAGDIQIFYKTAAYLFNYGSMAKKYINDMKDWQRKDGCMPHIAPMGGSDFYMNPMNGSPGWSDASVFIPYRQWKLYGDTEIIENNYDAMARFTDFVISRIGKNNVLHERLHLPKADKKKVINKGQSYGEWAEPADFGGFKVSDFVYPHPEVSTAYGYWQLKCMAEIADFMKKPNDRKKYLEYAKILKEGYQALRHSDNYPLESNRQALQVRPIYLGLLDAEDTERSQNILIKNMEDYGWRIGTGFLSTPLILYVLADIDLKYAYDLLENEKAPGWLAMPKSGANTVWESWESSAHNLAMDSRNHYAKGAMCQWLFEEMCGVNVTGENTFHIEPKAGGHITEASFSYDSVYGKIFSGWERKEKTVKYSIEIPSNCTAVIKLPGVEEKRVSAGKYEYEIKER